MKKPSHRRVLGVAAGLLGGIGSFYGGRRLLKSTLRSALTREVGRRTALYRRMGGLRGFIKRRQVGAAGRDLMESPIFARGAAKAAKYLR